MVGQAADVEEVGVRFPVWPVCPFGEVQLNIKKVYNFLVYFSCDFQAVFLIHLLNLLPQLLCEAVGQRAGSQPVVTVESELNREVFELVEEEESDEVRRLCSVKRPHGDVELLSLPLHPGDVAVVEDRLLAAKMISVSSSLMVVRVLAQLM